MDYLDDRPGYYLHRSIPPREGSRQVYVMKPLGTRNNDGEEIRGRRGDEEQHMLEDDKARKQFVFRLFALLSTQLSFTLFTILTFMSYVKLEIFMENHPLVWQVSGYISLFMYVLLILIPSLRRRKPLNCSAVSLMVFCFAIFISSLSSVHNVNVILDAFAIQTSVAVFVTILSKYAPCDVAGCGMIFCVLGTMLSVFGVVGSLVVMLSKFPLLDLVIAGGVVTVFTLYLLFDTQAMVESKNSVDPDEFVKGNIHLYIDIVLMFYHLIKNCFRMCFKKFK